MFRRVVKRSRLKFRKMANRDKILTSFSSRFKQGRFRKNEEKNGGGHKKRRPNWDSQRHFKQAQWEDKEDER